MFLAIFDEHRFSRLKDIFSQGFFICEFVFQHYLTIDAYTHVTRSNCDVPCACADATRLCVIQTESVIFSNSNLAKLYLGTEKSVSKKLL